MCTHSQLNWDIISTYQLGTPPSYFQGLDFGAEYVRFEASDVASKDRKVTGSCATMGWSMADYKGPTLDLPINPSVEWDLVQTRKVSRKIFPGQRLVLAMRGRSRASLVGTTSEHVGNCACLWLELCQVTGQTCGAGMNSGSPR